VEDNPYAAPRVEVLLPETAPDDLQLATRGQRFANILLDSVGMYAFLFIVLVPATVVAQVMGFSAVTLVEQYSLLIGAALVLIYYGGFEALFGRTPAKLLTRTKVVNESGLPPTILQILGRTLARNVPFEPFSCLGDPPIGWHDRWSGTRVVRTRPRPSLGPTYSLQDDGAGPVGLGRL
jgi:uncharacterized RDD family membrane protein YckC